MACLSLKKWIAGSIAICLALLSSRAIAQQQSVPPDSPQPWTGERGITETVAQLMERERLHPDDSHFNKPKRRYPDRSALPQDPSSPFVPRFPFDGNWNPPQATGFPSLIERHVGEEGQESPQTPSTQFTTATLGTSGFIPPDTMGDVSPTQVLIFANGRIQVYSKSGVLGGLNVTANTFFASVRNGSTPSDPVVIWDKTSSRWFVSAITTATPNRVVLAVSSGATIVDSTSFTFFFYQHDLVGTTPNSDTGGFADYVSMGVDANACYMGSNTFNSAGTALIGCTGFVVRKSSVLGAGPIVVTAFRQMSTPSAEGPYAPRGVTNDDPAATEGYFIGPSSIAFGRLTMRRILTPGATPTISGNLLITVPATVNPQTVPAMGSTTNIDVVSDDRCFQARMFRNRSTGVRTLWTAHHIEVTNAGVASTTGNRDGGRWYQLQNLTTTPALAQSGTLFDSSANAVHYVFPSAAMSGQGHMAIGTSSGGTTEFMGISVAGRLTGDAAGSTQARTVAIAGAGAYNVVAGDGRNRWGDYSALVVDPLDDQSMWAFAEYANAANSWAVRVTKLLAPPPATPTTLSPNTIAQGATNVAMTLTGTSASGSAFYDTEAGLTRIQAAFSTAGLTVNSVTRNSDTSLSLVVSASAGATLGASNITITNPDLQTATGNSLLTVTGGACVPASVTGQPSNQTVCSGNGASFTVTAAGDPTITYQWRKNTVNIPGATSPTYSIASTVAGDAGSYTCFVSNSCGNATSNAATLTVNTAPSITVNPSNSTVCSGAGASFTVAATGTPTPTFQWRKNTVNIGGATSSTYTIPATVAGDAGSYDCVVTNSCGGATSTAASLTVNTAPAITGNPSASTVCAGAPASFTASATGTPSPTFQWRKNAVNIGGATSSTYNIASAVTGDAGSYDCVVTNSCGNATSTAATLTVNTAPGVTAPPVGSTVCAGSPASFSVSVTGSPTPTFQWRKNTVDIPGATSSTYSIPVTTTADAGSYDVVITNPCGGTTPAAVTLTVNSAPAVTGNPANSTVCSGSPASFSVSATGTPAPTFQWRKNAINIGGANASSYSIPATTTGDAGSYDCVVTNSCGNATSTAATLTINTAPSVISSPSSTTECAGTAVGFTANFSGTPLPTVQWRKNGVNIPGATSGTYTIATLTTGDAGSYDCIATNSCGNATCNAAVLTVNTGPSITTNPLTQAVCEGSSVSFTVAASSTPAATFQWRKGGVPIPGATSTTFTIASTTGTDAADYDCVVTNTCGSVTSTFAQLTINSSPVITINPSNNTVCEGTSTSFATAATGLPVPTYQWRKNGVDIPGATSNTYVIPSPTTADAGSYDCVATNTCGTATCTASTLTVNTIPTFITNPTGATVCPGATVNFTVVATGTPTPTLQWRKDGVNIPGETLSTLTLTAVTAGDAGNYDCVATTPCGIATCSTATLAINTSCCDSIDFNNDGLYPDTADLDDFLSVFSGGPCSTDPVPGCNDLDFNNDSLFPDTLDYDALLSVFSGGPCL